MVIDDVEPVVAPANQQMKITMIMMMIMIMIMIMRGG